jgi:hypothetical protein
VLVARHPAGLRVVQSLTVASGDHCRPPRLGDRRLADLLLAAAGGIVVVSTVVVAAAHVGDRWGTDQTSGSWMALAKFANERVLYPPLFAHGRFGGTRYMPLQIVLNAAGARVTGEYLVSSKILSYAGAVLLFGLMFFVVRRSSRSWPLALALVGGILVTNVGSHAVYSFRGDAVPAALQLGAVTVALGGTTTVVVVAGVLCAVALMSKLSAVWAVAAITVWLGVRRRRRLLPAFLGAFAFSTAVLLGLFLAASEGRLLQNVYDLGGAGLPGPKGFFLGTLDDRFTFFGSWAGVMFLLAPLAIATVALSVHRRSLTIYQLGLGAASVVLLLILADVGAGGNQLLDVAVLVAVVVAELWREAGSDESLRVVRIIIAAALLWGIGGYYQTWLRGATFDAAEQLLGRAAPCCTARPLAGVIGSGKAVLSEDPYIPVSRGQDPVVLDAFMLVRILRNHPQWQQQLLAQIDAKDFAKVVLMEPLDPSDPWFHTYSLGAPVASALARNYQLSKSQDGYFVYTPRRQGIA